MCLYIGRVGALRGALYPLNSIGAGSNQLRKLMRCPPIGNGLLARLDLFCNAITLFMCTSVQGLSLQLRYK